MIPTELAEQVRAEVRSLKTAQEQFLRTYQQLCAHHGGAGWRNDKDIHVTFYHVRGEVIPIMEKAGLDHKSVQDLCSWAEKTILHR
jgi:hypothetical protein